MIRHTRAYVTLFTSDGYLPGVLALDFSLRLTRACYPLYVIVGSKVGSHAREALRRAGVRTIAAPELDIPPEIISANLSSDYHRHWAGVFEKLLIFSLEPFDKIVFLDSDMLVLRNLDELFDRPHRSAVSADRAAADSGRRVLNAGLMVVEPQPDVTAELLDLLPRVFETERQWRTAAGRPVSMGVQALINTFWSDWSDKPDLHLHPSYNVLVNHLDDYVRGRGHPCVGRDGIRILHFIGEAKPWMWTPATFVRRVARLLARGRMLEAAAIVVYRAACGCAGARLRVRRLWPVRSSACTATTTSL